MKKLNFKTLLGTLSVLMILFVAGNVAYGSGNTYVFPVKGSQEAIIHFAVPENSDASISIVDINGNGIYYATVPSGKVYSKLFDFTNLDEGLYSLYITLGNIIDKNEFEVNHSGISLVKTNKEYKPSFSRDGKFMLVNFLNEGANKVSISMRDNLSTFYTEKDPGSFPFEKAYDISNLPAGDYSVVLTAGGNDYYYYFEL
jgi:hypothetical protein